MAGVPEGETMATTETDTTTKPGPLATTPAVTNLSTTDLDRSKRFYTEKLGLPLAMEMGANAFMVEAGGGTNILVYIRDEPPKAKNTAVSFHVGELDPVVEDLKARGVSFEEYDLPHLKTEDGISDDGHMRAAWFKDPDGNIIGLFEASKGS